MKVLHTADWHLGQFKGPVENGVNIRSLDTERCLDYMVSIAREEKPELVCVSGDVFHQEQIGPVRMSHEVLEAAKICEQLADVSRFVIVMRGTPNHDGGGQFQVLEQLLAHRKNIAVIITPQVISTPVADIACIHLIFSERKLLEHAEFKKASRNMFFDEHGKHVRTKKEILDEHGEIRKGCYIVAKGDTYDIRNFQSKETIFKSKAFTAGVKEMYTDFINELVKEDQNKLTVFRHDGPYLATKKIGKHNPKEVEIKEDNAKRQEWNHAVDEALTAGLPEEKICQVKKDCIQKPIHESIEKTGFHPDLLSAILQAAIRALLDLIRAIPKKVHKEPVFDAEVFRRMQGVRKDLLHQNQVIAAARHRCERAQAFSAEASKPANIFKRGMKTKAAKELAASLLEYENAIAEPDNIVKRAGYKNVAAFTKAYEKSCKLLESMKRTEPQKESIIASLRKYEKEALIRKGGFSRGVEEQTHIKTKEDVR